MEEEKNKIYVGNLEYSVNEEELKKTFEDKGIHTKNLKIIKDKYTGKSKGFGFVEVENEEIIQQAIDSLDGKELKGRKLRISRARKPKPRFERGRHPRFSR
ncbi:MAG: RNA-binding protein [Candidatus Omnitrophota bacterium]|nr:MAG: RNA-binding protein [Candidatus Omnitrophota bacterium]RKY45809.1 MAG: RNA-binding protein [Candidatus Omnitrophota bacterium]